MPYTVPEWAKSPPDATTPRLLSSYEKAPKKDMTPLPGTLDVENGSATFSGRHGNYAVTLTGCPCGSNPKPCKHMYRLAMELGIMPGVLSSSSAEVQNRYKANETEQISLHEAVAELENLDDPAQLFLKDVLRTVSNIEVTSFRFRLPENAYGALQFPYLSYSPVSAADIMNAMRKKDITAIMDRLSINPDSNLKKADLIPWCIQNIPALSGELPKEYYVSCRPSFRSVVKKVYAYLRRKYEWSSSSAGVTSIGGPDVYHLPDDEITGLLTLYGHNRCQNGSDPRGSEV